MSSVGLLYVGAVLFINGLMLLGIIPGKSAAILNFFVGGMQVIFPTIILMQSPNDPAVIFGAAGLYLFGFTYLYVGILQMTGISGEGLGWFSLFVAASAIVIGVRQITTLADPVFGAIWLIWAVLWFLFFLVLGLHKESLTRATGWFAIFAGLFTCATPAFLLLTGTFQTNALLGSLLGVLGVAALVASLRLGQLARTNTPAAPTASGAPNAPGAPTDDAAANTPQPA